LCLAACAKRPGPDPAYDEHTQADTPSIRVVGSEVSNAASFSGSHRPPKIIVHSPILCAAARTLVIKILILVHSPVSVVVGAWYGSDISWTLDCHLLVQYPSTLEHRNLNMRLTYHPLTYLYYYTMTSLVLLSQRKTCSTFRFGEQLDQYDQGGRISKSSAQFASPHALLEL
jgi:hypothetical protein